MYLGKLSLFTCDILNPPYDKNEILWTSVIQALSRQCFQICAVKIQYHQATGYWNFQNLKIGLEVFLNFSPCVYIKINA